jgi:hypothetical protein
VGEGGVSIGIKVDNDALVDVCVFVLTVVCDCVLGVLVKYELVAFFNEVREA